MILDLQRVETVLIGCDVNFACNSNAASAPFEIVSGKWPTWHGKTAKLFIRMKPIYDMFGVAPEDAAHRSLWSDLRGAYLVPGISYPSTFLYLRREGSIGSCWHLPGAQSISRMADFICLVIILLPLA
jgi:hypothetical protein